MEKGEKLVVVYDVFDDRRRVRLHNKLKKYGKAVQYSVFECELTKSQKESMVAEIAKIIRKRQDDVVIYTLCGHCAGLTIRLHHGAKEESGSEMVV